MGAKWVKGANAKAVLQRYEQQCSINGDGAVQINGLEFFEIEAVLHEIIDYGENLSFSVLKEFRDRALRDCYREKRKITPDDFLHKLNAQISTHKASKARNYSLVSSISVSGVIPVRFRLPEVDVRLYSELPKKYETRVAHYKRWEGFHEGMSALPSGHSVVVAYVSEKHQDDAVRAAIDGIDFIRGVMGMTLNDGMTYSLGNGIKRLKPINKVLLGGLHTLHLSNGRSVDNEFWYEPGYVEYPPVLVKKDRAKSLFGSMRAVMSGVLAASKEDFGLLYDSIIRYTRALDEPDSDVALIKLWAALEPLVGKNASNASDALVRRCSFVFREGDYIAQCLESIRRYRNKSVHRGIVNDSSKIYCYQLQNILRRILYFYANSLGSLTSIDEVNEFLDLPTDSDKLISQVEILRRKTWLARKAFRFRGHPDI